jgi:hypothetical protein
MTMILRPYLDRASRKVKISFSRGGLGDLEIFAAPSKKGNASPKKEGVFGTLLSAHRHAAKERV